MKILPVLTTLKESVISITEKLGSFRSRKVKRLENVKKMAPEQIQVPRKPLAAYKVKSFDKHLEKLLCSSVKEWIDITPKNFHYKKIA